MIRTMTASALTALMLCSVSVRAEERPTAVPVATVAPVAEAVAQAWVKEAGKPSSSTVRALLVTYGAVQGLDMVSTYAARNRGAVEANPLMQGSYGKGIAMKAAMGAVTIFAVRAIEKKSKKAAVITMIALNVGTAAVIANNLHNARAGAR